MKYFWFFGSLCAFGYSIYLLAINQDADAAWWMALCALWYAFFVQEKKVDK